MRKYGNCLTLSNNSCWLLLSQMSWKWADNGKIEIQTLAGMIWKRCSKQNWWNMLYLRVIPRKSRFYIKSQFWKSFHWGHFLSKDQLVPIAQWAEIFSEEGPYSIFLHSSNFHSFIVMLLQYYRIEYVHYENKFTKLASFGFNNSKNIVFYVFLVVRI